MGEEGRRGEERREEGRGGEGRRGEEGRGGEGREGLRKGLRELSILQGNILLIVLKYCQEQIKKCFMSPTYTIIIAGTVSPLN